MDGVPPSYVSKQESLSWKKRTLLPLEYAETGHEPEQTGFRAMLTAFVAIEQSFPPRNRSLLVYTYLGYLPPIWIPLSR